MTTRLNVMPEPSEVSAVIPSEEEIAHTARLMSILAYPQRLRLLAAIHAHPGSNVGQLADDLDIDTNQISYLARKLREEELVSRTLIGRTAHYRICNPEVKAMLATWSNKWAENAESVDQLSTVIA